MKSQDLDTNSTVAIETRSPSMVKSWRGNWGHGSSQNSHPLTVCYAAAKKKAKATAGEPHATMPLDMTATRRGVLTTGLGAAAGLVAGGFPLAAHADDTIYRPT